MPATPETPHPEQEAIGAAVEWQLFASPEPEATKGGSPMVVQHMKLLMVLN